MRINAFGMTDVGCRRENNEDAFLQRDDLLLFVVADGVGGAAAGEIASQLFAQSAEQIFEAHKTHTDRPKDNSELINRCFTHANQAIINHTKQHPETKGMGCTAETLTFANNEYYLGHVGDSRTYLIRNQTMEQLTKDHSYIQEQLDLGLVSEIEAQTHWLRNAIYRALGQRDDIEVDLLNGRVKHNDCFLLCSDGLTDMLSNDRILAIILSNQPLPERTQQLIDEAKDNGGKDNVTVVLCEVSIDPNQNFISQVKNRLLGNRFKS